MKGSLTGLKQGFDKDILIFYGRQVLPSFLCDVIRECSNLLLKLQILLTGVLRLLTLRKMKMTHPLPTKDMILQMTNTQLSRCITASWSSSGLSLGGPTKVKALKSFLFTEGSLRVESKEHLFKFVVTLFLSHFAQMRQAVAK